MKNPLTSKERRGLTAVAAAALLCIASGFIFRSCSSCNRSGNNAVLIISEDDSLPIDSINGDRDFNNADSTLISKKPVKSKNNRNKTNASKKKKTGKSSQKRKTEKVYPTRDPLSQPCD